MPDDLRLVCPDCRPEVVHLVEFPDDDSRVYCPNCPYHCQNYVRYPVVEVHDFSTGEMYLWDILKKERVEPAAAGP